MTSNEEEALAKARKERQQRAARRRRWLEILGYGLLAGLINLVLIRLLRDRLVSLTNLPSDIGWPVLGIAILALTYAAWVPIKQHETPAPWYGIWRWRALMGFKHLGEYPPLWIACLLGLGLTAVGLVHFAHGLGLDVIPTSDASLTIQIHAPNGSGVLHTQALATHGPWLGPFFTYEIVWMWSIIATTVIFCGVVFWRAIRPRSPVAQPSEETADAPPPSSEPAIYKADLDTFENIKLWLKDDRPITTKDGDRFGFSSLARTMAERLRATPPPSQAVVGAFGSGKSTLGRLVKQELERQSGKPVRLVQVELWPFETPEAAVSGMIRHLLDAMADEIPVIGLSGLPRRYINAMRAKGGWWASAGSLLEPSASSPVETLAELDAVATAIGVRYVLWVDDLERFAAKDSQATADQRLQPIRAFLHGFNERNALSCVTATVELGPFHLDKIARYVVELPEIQAEDALKILKSFRDGCLAFDFIDPNEKNRERDNPLECSGQTKDSNISGRLALPELSKVPRALKQGLRRCLDFWKRYAGEIDFDDLLVVSILRESQPIAFAAYRDSDPRREPKQDKATTTMHQMVRARYQSENAPVSEATLDAIHGLQIHLKFSQKPQGFTARHADYWRRYTNEPSLLETEKDQPFLRAIKGHDFTGLISDHLRNVDEKERWLAFAKGNEDFTPEFMLDLFEHWIVQRCSESPMRDWPQAIITPAIPTAAPGIGTLLDTWKTTNRDRLPWNTVGQSLSQHTDQIIAHNLTLAVDLEGYITSYLKNEEDLDPAVIEEWKHQLRQAIADRFMDNPTRLAKALEGQSLWALMKLARGAHEVYDEENKALLFDKKEWCAFSETLLKAIPNNPEEVLPQIAWLVGDVPKPPEFRPYAPNPELIQAYFDPMALKAALHDQRPENWGNDPVVQAFIREVQALPEEAADASTSSPSH